MLTDNSLSQQLVGLDAKLLQAANFDEGIQVWCTAVCNVLQAECIGLFLANEDGVTISSKVTTGIAASVRIKLPINPFRNSNSKPVRSFLKH